MNSVVLRIENLNPKERERLIYWYLLHHFCMGSTLDSLIPEDEVLWKASLVNRLVFRDIERVRDSAPPHLPVMIIPKPLQYQLTPTDLVLKHVLESTSLIELLECCVSYRLSNPIPGIMDQVTIQDLQPFLVSDYDVMRNAARRRFEELSKV